MPLSFSESVPTQKQRLLRIIKNAPHGLLTMKSGRNISKQPKGKQQMEHTKTSERYQYDPNHLLETLIQKLNLKNDAALSRALEVAPPLISKIRHRRLPVGASLLIRMHEVSDLSIKDLRELMGDRRTKFRISDKQFKPKDSPNGAAGANGAA